MKNNTQKLDWVKVQLTRSCNLKCAFCSQADFKENKVVDVDLFIKNVLEVSNPRLLIITGGEPLTRLDQLYKLLDYCKNNNIETGIFTNATLITKEIALKLKELDVDWIRVSVNGYNADIHEKSYPKGTFEPTIRGIKTLKEVGLYVKTRTTVTKTNQDYIEELIKLIISLGVKELDFRPYLELGDCNPHQDNSLSNEELIKNCAKLIKYKEKYNKDLAIKLLPNWFDFIYSDYISPDLQYKTEICNCGRKYIYIDSAGNYRACAGHRLILGNMQESKVDEIWVGCPFLQEVRNYKQDEYCQKCEYKVKCHAANCHLINYEAHGRFDKINPCCPIYLTDKDNIENAKVKLIKKFTDYLNEKN